MRKKVLIIEDDQFSREIYEEIFLRSGYRVILAENGTEGFSAILEKNPDFVLLDLMLPKMDGVTLLKKLQAKEKRNKLPVPVIVLTNLEQKSILDLAMELGVKGYIIKANLTPIQVVQEVEKMLSK